MTTATARVEAVIAKQFGTRAFTYATLLRGNDGGLNADSLGLVQLAVNLENEFGIELSDDDVADAETVGDVIARVKRKVGAGPQSSETERTATHG